MTLADAAARAADAIRSSPAGARWLLACDDDADGLCAGAVMALALRHAGRRFTVRASRDKSEAAMRALFGEGADGVVLLDKGTAHLAVLAEQGASSGRTPVVVVDHHNLAGPEPAGVTLLNPRAEGLDGSRDASASTTACALALALCGDAALAWAPTALAGAVGDLQDRGGWSGWNKELAERAARAGHLDRMPLPNLRGDLARALAALEPAIPGLRGDEAAAVAFLESLGIGRGDDVEDLAAEQRTRLVSALLLRLTAAGQAPDDPTALLGHVDRHVALGASLRSVAQTADACGRQGQPGIGLAYLMGDKGARAEALACRRDLRAALAEAVQALRDAGLERRRAIQVGWTDRPPHSGLVANRAIEEGVAAPELATVILARRPDGAVQVSTRASESLAAAGLDLGRACSAAAEAADGSGGGHPSAAGAVVPDRNVAAFLEALERELLDQGWLGRA
jgi:single-stranded-DNA-specific exonuclease